MQPDTTLAMIKARNARQAALDATFQLATQPATRMWRLPIRAAVSVCRLVFDTLAGGLLIMLMCGLGAAGFAFVAALLGWLGQVPF